MQFLNALETYRFVTDKSVNANSSIDATSPPLSDSDVADTRLNANDGIVWKYIPLRSNVLLMVTSVKE